MVWQKREQTSISCCADGQQWVVMQARRCYDRCFLAARARAAACCQLMLVLHTSASFVHDHSAQTAASGATAATDLAPGATIRVLAFGDSLTAGFTEMGLRHHPYALKLQELLRAHNPLVKVDEKGISGEQVLLTMRERLAGLLHEAAASGCRYRWVLILAGINDIGMGSKADQIFQGLRKMYRACYESGARVVAMTNTENAWSTRGSGEVERVKLNALIREYVARHSGDSGAVLVDLDKHLQYTKLTDTQRLENFDDGLHFTSKGYDRVGELLAEALKPHIPAGGNV